MKLNAICPYFTMFPLDFPLGILRESAAQSDRVLDPFCGRGTTSFAARVLGLESHGVDSSPVAVAITEAKLANVSPAEIVGEAARILSADDEFQVPEGEFWEHAYHRDVLRTIVKFRGALLENCSSPARKALRGVLLGALHGPLTKRVPSHLSNQCPRTFAPKPAYAVRFWTKRKLSPPRIDVMDVVRVRANRYFSKSYAAMGSAALGDSRLMDPFLQGEESPFSWVITSPPYYGMKTYIPDQWLRNWFLGGKDSVDYSAASQLQHSDPQTFAFDLRSVWWNVASVCGEGAHLVIRFGGIMDRKADPTDIILQSLRETPWTIEKVSDAGSPPAGRRQADSFLVGASLPLGEVDVWARLAA